MGRRNRKNLSSGLIEIGYPGFREMLENIT